MLSLLKIRNLALVDELLWEPGAGFLSITGETGAGKSVIMGGISLVLGARADKGLIRSGESQCSLEAVFHLKDTSAADSLLQEAGVPLCEEGELIIRRVITATGNRQFVNSSPVTLSLLRQLGGGLVDMHHPEAHRSLTSQERQMDLVDAFAENAAVHEQYHAAYKAWLAAAAEYRHLLESELTNERELDFLRHQVNEIEQAGFTADEVAGLEDRWQRARNASRLRDTALPMLQVLEDSDNGVVDRLRQAVRHARDLERLDGSCASWMSTLENAIEELSDLSGKVEDYLSDLCSDPSELMELENRIGLLDNLKRKYGADFEAIEAHLQECHSKLAAVDNREDLLRELADTEHQRKQDVLRAATLLTQSRKKAIPALEKSFLTHAAQLGFRQSLFQVALTALPEPGPHGIEEMEFLFGPNPGEPLKPLRLIASSGEMARVMLALKSALARQDDTPLLIFDEIDANVGGEIARAVGRKMRELGQEHQVIAITHFPQVAALADHHYLISKGVQDGRTVSRLQEVSGDARIQELVRMLGTGGATAEAHARELLLGK